MSFFDRFKKKPLAPQVPKAARSSVTALPVAAETSEEKPSSGSSKPRTVLPAVRANLLLKPHVSEKAAYLADRGVYVFDVPIRANKIEIRKAVEGLYRVDVTKVRTERGPGKVMSRGRIAGQRKDWKKALVEVKKGQSINLVEGV